MPVEGGKVPGGWVGGKCSQNTPGLCRTEGSKLLGLALCICGTQYAEAEQLCKAPMEFKCPCTERSCGELKSGSKDCETSTSPVRTPSP